MAITQARLIALLTAAEDCLNASQRILSTAATVSSSYDEYWFKEFSKNKVQDFLSTPLTTISTIASERERIRLTKYHNDRRRARNAPPEEQPTPDPEPDYFKLLFEGNVDAVGLRPTASISPNAKEQTK